MSKWTGVIRSKIGTPAGIFRQAENFRLAAIFSAKESSLPTEEEKASVMYLVFPRQVLLAFSLELYLKTLYAISGKVFGEQRHDLWELYKELDSKIQSVMQRHFSDAHLAAERRAKWEFFCKGWLDSGAQNIDDPVAWVNDRCSMVYLIKHSKDAFQTMRYFYEYGANATPFIAYDVIRSARSCAVELLPELSKLLIGPDPSL